MGVLRTGGSAARVGASGSAAVVVALTLRDAVAEPANDDAARRAEGVETSLE